MRAGYFDDFGGLGVGVAAWLGRVRVGSGLLVPGVVPGVVGSGVVGSGAVVPGAEEVLPVEVTGIRVSVDCAGLGARGAGEGLGTPTTTGPAEVVGLGVGAAGRPAGGVATGEGVVLAPTDVGPWGP